MSLVLCVGVSFAAEPYSWQQPHAKVLPTGDLEWAPTPFEFVAGETVRYIDYENGDDAQDGATRETAWKHHPWDTRATGRAAQGAGVATYVFKRGVHYRLYSYGDRAEMVADESGKPGDPIRLTSDPSWGDGEAVIAGSKPIEQTWQRAGADDAPERMDTENQAVWFVDVNLPNHPQEGGYRPMEEITIFQVNDNGKAMNLHVASDVGWEMSSPHFAMHHWNKWNDHRRQGQTGGGLKADVLQGKPADYYNGGTLWSQYAWVIANPTADEIEPGDYDPTEGTLKFKKGKDPVNPGTRFLIEDLPQFLDQPGEYYYARKYEGNKGRLFVRLHEDRNPNDTRIEMSTAYGTLTIRNQGYIDISGLSFRFNGRTHWLRATNVILLDGFIRDVNIHHCRFDHLGNDAIRGYVEANEKMDHIRVTDCDFEWINGGTAVDLKGQSGKLKPGQKLGELGHAAVLRNRTRFTGLYRHNDHRWSNVPALTCEYARVAEVAGNIVESAWGSGIVVQGGAGGKGREGFDIPLTRLLVHHNKIEYTALGVNDYGGISLWQHGPIFAYNNIVGNAVGHWPGGFFNSGDTNLSYPIYLDGGFKIYSFNNISWARPFRRDDPYTSMNAAYFNVFGYLNPFVNNTVYGSGKAFGGTSGNRNDYIGNALVEITKNFISVNHGGNPSLIGGDDPGTSGIDGAGTLAYAHNLFHGSAEAGTVATEARGAKKDLSAKDLDTLQQQMENYPLRSARLGKQAQEMPLRKPLPTDKEKPSATDADWRPAPGSPGIDAGADYFVPWSLAGTVGEWHFNRNAANPKLVLDYHHYPTKAYFNRSMYYKVPVFEININEATEKSYVDSPSEDWTAGALEFDGSRFGVVSHERLTRDVLISVAGMGEKPVVPPVPWIAPSPRGKDRFGKPVYSKDAYLRYPGFLRKTPAVKSSNMLVEANLRIVPDHTGGQVVGKHDGQAGYRLFVDEQGRVQFQVSAGGEHSSVASAEPLNDGEWHHVVAELDKWDGRMTIYVDGKESAGAKASLDKNATLQNEVDFLVGCDSRKQSFFRGALDFMRICHGTLKDSETDIAELYEWQTNGPVKYDFAGNAPEGRRDAGALEAQSSRR